MKNIFKRCLKNPIMLPDLSDHFESAKVYNPSVLKHDGKYYLYYRACGRDGVSAIKLAISEDGIHFQKEHMFVLEPLNQKEIKGVEDPRITEIEGKYVLTYTAYDGHSARLNSAISTNLKYFTRQGEMLKDWDAEAAGVFTVPWDKAQQNEIAKKDWCKGGGVFPKKIHGEYFMLFGDRNIHFAKSKDLIKWDASLAFVSPRKDYFDSVHVEMGPAPIETEQGWLVIYHGVDDKAVYRLGYLLLDKNDPSIIKKRSDEAIFEPEEIYELGGNIDIASDTGIRPKVVFCCGAILEGEKLRIYYGGGDSVICMAETSLDKLGLKI